MTQDRESLIEQRLSGMAATIRSQIPGAQVRLFGSWARGQAGPESDIDLLITVPDAWLDQHNRWRTLSELRRSLAMADTSLDLLLLLMVFLCRLPITGRGPGEPDPGKLPPLRSKPHDPAPWDQHQLLSETARQSR